MDDDGDVHARRFRSRSSVRSVSHFVRVAHVCSRCCLLVAVSSSSQMPKNKGKGGKNRRRGKNEGELKREAASFLVWPRSHRRCSLTSRGRFMHSLTISD